jgi:pimeloyl-ACP methyl ester carboxylesterase
MYKDILFVRHDPDGRIFYFSHTDFDGLNKTPFEFKSRKGHILKGGFYYYDNPRQDRLIVFDHGLGVGHRGYMREIETICRKGYMVFTYDHTGCGDSEGESIQGLSGSLADLDDCIRTLKRIDSLSGREISVIGHSWGGFSSLNILGYHHDIHSVVAMSAFISVSTMHSQIVPFIVFPFRKQLMELEDRTNHAHARSSALDVVNKTNKPILIIHSLDDSTVSAEKNILRLRKETCERTNLEFILQNGKGHSVNYTREAADYKREFFRTMDRLKKKDLLETEEQKIEFVSSYDWYAMTEQDEELWEKIFIFLEK